MPKATALKRSATKSKTTAKARAKAPAKAKSKTARAPTTEPKELSFMSRLLEKKREAQKTQESARKANGTHAANDHTKFGPQGFARFQGPRRRAA